MHKKPHADNRAASTAEIFQLLPRARMALDDLIPPDQQFGSLWWIAEVVIRVAWHRAGEFNMKHHSHPGLCAHEGMARGAGEAVRMLFGRSSWNPNDFPGAFRVMGLDPSDSTRLTFFRATLRPLPPKLFASAEKEGVWPRKNPPHRLSEPRCGDLRTWLRAQLPPPPRN